MVKNCLLLFSCASVYLPPTIRAHLPDHVLKATKVLILCTSFFTSRFKLSTRQFLLLIINKQSSVSPTSFRVRTSTYFPPQRLLSKSNITCWRYVTLHRQRRKQQLQPHFQIYLYQKFLTKTTPQQQSVSFEPQRSMLLNMAVDNEPLSFYSGKTG